MASSSSTSKRTTKMDESESNDKPSKSDESSSVKDLANGKRMKKDDSGINVVQESDISDGSECGDIVNAAKKFLGASKNHSDESERESADSGNLESNSPTDFEHGAVAETTLNSEHEENSPSPRLSRTRSMRLSEAKNSSDEDTDDDEIQKVDKNKDEKDYDPTPSTPRPKHNWVAPKVVSSRQYGFSSKYSPDLFRYNCYGSLHMVERLELMYKMKKHDGCVNALNFNVTGTKLVSGSDDLRVIIWDWIVSEPVLEYRSGHGTNVFQAKYVPLTNDCFIVTCARDGQVRLGELSSEGVCKGTRKLVQHKGSAHRLSVQMDSPHNILTCGEDAAVFSIDLRQEKPTKLVICKSKEKKVPLYSIFINPYKPHEFAVGGRSQYVKVYDARFIPEQSEGWMKQYCPEHLVSDDKLNVTSLVYNYNGQEILASYNDEDIYIFDAQEQETSKYLHRYRGHRNNQTVKGVNYFGSNCEYIMSGSDCGYIFFWEKESEHVVKYMYGDEGGSVNCLEPNPTMPVLATSGLDDDIKIWVPSCEEPPDLSGLKTHLIRNMKQRDDESNRDYPDEFVDQTIWLLMQHLSRARRVPIVGSDNDSDSSTASSDEVDDSGVSVAQCTQS